MSNTLLSPLLSLRLSDNDIPPVTATLCRWHLQPRPRPPKPQILQHAGTRPTARTPTKITDPAIHSSQQFRPRAAKSRRTSPEIPIDRHCRRRILPPRFPPSRLFGRPPPCSPSPVTGRHPKTLNDSGPSALTPERGGHPSRGTRLLDRLATGLRL